MIKKQLGSRIAFLRRKAGFTQEKFAEMTDYSVEFVSFVERGINSPSIEGCDRIASALNIPIRELFVFDQPIPWQATQRRKNNELTGISNASCL